MSDPRDTRDRNDDDDVRLPGLEQLSMSSMPERDLWPDIASRLPPQRKRGAPLWALAAAASVLAAVGGFVAWQVQDPRLSDTPIDVAPASVAAATLNPGASRQYVAMATHQPGDRALVKANLRIVDDAQSELRRAIATDPDSAYLRRLMSQTESRQRELRELLGERE